MKRVVILGSTGSIGRAAVEIAAAGSDEIDVVGLAAGRNAEELSGQLGLFPGAVFTVRDDEVLKRMENDLGVEGGRCVGTGQGAISSMIEDLAPDLVVNALVGISGLMPTVTSLAAGCDVALANKETLVTAGEIVMALSRKHGARLIPVDSEHFSLSRCLGDDPSGTIEIILTASGGPFFGRDPSTLEGVTVAEVLDHPTWEMGKKVTVDSAHLMNKGLEVIEAHHLFGFGLDAINVVIHPQSIIHSLTRMRDGSLLAHLAPPDMRLPIMNAMYYPEIRGFPWGQLEPGGLGSLEFFPLDCERYPAFSLALGAAREGGDAAAVLNAADEVAVSAFLSGRIGFMTIIDWIEEALDAHITGRISEPSDVLDADRRTREFLEKRYGRQRRP